MDYLGGNGDFLSVLMGLFNYFGNISYHKSASDISERISDKIEKAKSQEAVDKLSQAADPGQARARRQAARSKALMISQIICVILGLVLTVAFVASLLFYTATQEDYTEDLPIYDEIMEDQAAEDNAQGGA